jgi:hypothetical protein
MMHWIAQPFAVLVLTAGAAFAAGSPIVPLATFQTERAAQDKTAQTASWSGSIRQSACTTTAGETGTAQPKAVRSRAATMQTTPGSVRRLAAAECEHAMTVPTALHPTAAADSAGIEPEPRVWKAEIGRSGRVHGVAGTRPQPALMPGHRP